MSGPYRRRRANRSKTGLEGLSWVAWVRWFCVQPLSAQAQVPSRRSGGAKEQKAAKSQCEGSAGHSLVGCRIHRARLVADCHHLPSGPPSVKTAQNLCGTEALLKEYPPP